MCESDLESLPKPSSHLKSVLAITFLLPVIIGCLGNSVAIVIVAKVLRSRQTVPNVMIMVLACVDMLTICLGFVPALLNYFSGLSIAHAPLCNFQGAVTTFLFAMSIMLVSCLSFDRFLALYTPFFYKTHAVFSCKKLATALAVFSSVAMLLCLLPAVGLGKYILQYPGTFCLFELKPKDLAGKITLSTILTFLLSCTVIVVTCNSAVSWRSFRMLKRSREQRPNDVEKTGSSLSVCSTDECQFLILSTTVMISFCCCWMTFMVRAIMLQAGSPFDSCWDMLAVRLVTLQSISNPWVYLMTRRQYRKAFWYIIKRCAYYICCKTFCTTEESLDDILGLPAPRVVEYAKDERTTDSKVTLLLSRPVSMKGT